MKKLNAKTVNRLKRLGRIVTTHTCDRAHYSSLVRGQQFVHELVEYCELKAPKHASPPSDKIHAKASWADIVNAYWEAVLIEVTFRNFKRGALPKRGNHGHQGLNLQIDFYRCSNGLISSQIMSVEMPVTYWGEIGPVTTTHF